MALGTAAKVASPRILVGIPRMVFEPGVKVLYSWD